MNQGTLIDLNIISESSESDSFLKRFDFTKNDESRARLKNFLVGDVISKSEITALHEMLEFFIHNIERLDLGISNSDLYYLKEYLAYDKTIIKNDHLFTKAIQYLNKTIKYRPQINFITSGVIGFIIFLGEKWRIIKDLRLDNCPLILKEKLQFINSIVSTIGINELIQPAYSGDIPFFKVLELDNIFRVKSKDSILRILSIFYEIEALVSISKSTIKYNLVFPEINETNVLTINGLFHPFVKNCIKNNFAMNETDNLFFLTGPNMSGKSTFLKSIGATVYLAMRGLPVPAEHASIPIFDDVIININTQDDLFKGDSYFISELKKVKEIALKLEEGKKCFVIFDELFKGTNFIDSKECSKLVIQGFTNFSTSRFIISTHIVELYKELEKTKPIRSVFLETEIKENIPHFTYKLKNGISEVRLGMYLLEKQGIKKLLFKIN